jgi:hypothetical protein
MFRLYFLTFSGVSRADEQTQRAIHESPPSMTMPLVVLAAGAVVLGVLGIPGKANLFHHWLAPVLERGWFIAGGEPRIAAVQDNALVKMHLLEYVLMAASVVVALVGIVFAHRYYSGGPSPQAERAAQRLGIVYRAVLNKYWIDEVYRWLIVKPVWGLAVGLWKAVDAFIIDLVGVNGSAWVVDAVGRISRRLHNGHIQRYVVGMVLGVATIVVWVSYPPDGFAVKAGGVRPGQKVAIGQRVIFDASREFSGDQRTLEYQWDFDGDGVWDTTWTPAAVATHAYGRKGSFNAVLKVRDRRWRTIATESKTVEVQ